MGDETRFMFQDELRVLIKSLTSLPVDLAADPASLGVQSHPRSEEAGIPGTGPRRPKAFMYFTVGSTTVCMEGKDSGAC